MLTEALGVWLAPWTLLLTLAVAAVFLYWRSKYPPFKWGETAGPVPNSLLVPVVSVGGLIFATGAVQLAGAGFVQWWGLWLGALLTGLGVLSVTVFRRVERYYAQHTRWLIVGLTIASALGTLLWWAWWQWWLPWLLLILLIAYLIWIGSVVLVCGCGGGGGGGTPTGSTKCNVTIGVTMTPVSGGPSSGSNYTRSFVFTAASSKGHALGAVAVDSVETSVTRLTWSAMTTGGQTTTPGDPTDVTPETSVDTTVSYADTSQRWVRITTSYTCPTCGAATSKVTQERIN